MDMKGSLSLRVSLSAVWLSLVSLCVWRLRGFSRCMWPAMWASFTYALFFTSRGANRHQASMFAGVFSWFQPAGQQEPPPRQTKDPLNERPMQRLNESASKPTASQNIAAAPALKRKASKTSFDAAIEQDQDQVAKNPFRP